MYESLNVENWRIPIFKIISPAPLIWVKKRRQHVSGTPGVQKLGRESFRELSGPDNIRFSSRKSKSNNKVLFSNCKYVCWWAGMQPPGFDPLGDLLFVPSKTVQQHSFVKGGEGLRELLRTTQPVRTPSVILFDLVTSPSQTILFRIDILDAKNMKLFATVRRK